jgi:hypothetical protein
VNENIVSFHGRRLEKIKSLKLHDLLRRKNPYLFRAKNLIAAPDLVNSLLDAYVSSSEEELFGEFLEGLAIYASELFRGGRKSAAEGIDLEIDHGGTRFVVSIKSGPNWGNKGQYRDLAQIFRRAAVVLGQNRRVRRIQPVLGICYGRRPTRDADGYLRLCGQSFWHFISGEADFYTEIIEPLGYRAREHNDNYLAEKATTYSRFTHEFLHDFCEPDGRINWVKLVEFNSGQPPAPKARRRQRP